MQHQQLQFEHARRAVMRHGHQHIGFAEQVAQRRGAAPAEHDDDHVARVRGFDAGLERAVLPQRIDQQQHVAALAQRLHLLGEDLLRRGARGQRAQQHAVGSQRQGRQARTFAFEAADEGGADMLRQRRAAAQAADQQLAAGGDAADQRLRGFGDRPARLSAVWYWRSALSKNCCWMRCSSMSMDHMTRLVARRFRAVRLTRHRRPP